MSRRNKRALMMRDPLFENGFWPFDMFRELDEGFGLYDSNPRDLVFRPVRIMRRRDSRSEGMRMPRTDFKDKGDSFEIKAELPGISKENIEITLKEDVIEISARQEDEIRETDENYFHREIGARTYRRSFALPEKVDKKKVEAKMENGVLYLQLPKKAPKEDKKKHTIPIS